MLQMLLYAAHLASALIFWNLLQIRCKSPAGLQNPFKSTCNFYFLLFLDHHLLLLFLLSLSISVLYLKPDCFPFFPRIWFPHIVLCQIYLLIPQLPGTSMSPSDSSPSNIHPSLHSSAHGCHLSVWSPQSPPLITACSGLGWIWSHIFSLVLCLYPLMLLHNITARPWCRFITKTRRASGGIPTGQVGRQWV